jgi:hypothetical protein
MMIQKIISGGQTGADQAALDVAIKLGVAHGGWVPKGRKTEAGILPEKYQVSEMPTSSYAERTEQNVIDSDGTLVVSHGPLTGGSEVTRNMAAKHGRPFLHMDLDQTPAFLASISIKDWILRNGLKVLNVAGPRASRDAKIYQAVLDLLEATYYLLLMEAAPIGAGDSARERRLMVPDRPKRVAQAVTLLISRIPFRDKIMIAKMSENELLTLDPMLGQYIRSHFGLWGENDLLLESCRTLSQSVHLTPEAASAVIIRELWKGLRQTHKLRVVK